MPSEGGRETGIHEEADLAAVRRLEAAAFRGFPSAILHYDRTWAVRLTAGHPARRLNSVNPLDPLDDADLNTRLAVARKRFEEYGRELIIRQTPLMPPSLVAFLDDNGWVRLDTSLVMVAPVSAEIMREAVDRLPLQDIGRWVDGYLALSRESRTRKAGLVEVISAIQPASALFLSELADGQPLACVRCACDGDLAGIFELETHRELRRQGHGHSILSSAMKWAAASGAGNCWLQVTADNAPAVSLYRRLGYLPVYAYCYRRAPK